MTAVRRVLLMAEMHGRDLTRRHIALGLLVALPLTFYLTSGRHGEQAVTAGGVGMAFAVSGAALFSVLSSQAVDQRLVLGGYRPVELLAGRLLFLAPLGLVIASGFSALMTTMSSPERPWILVLGVAVVAVQSVPLGLLIGSAIGRELEGTLVLIGVVGIQLASDTGTITSKVLPFYGARQLVEGSMHPAGAIALPLVQAAAYAVAMLLAGRLLIGRRLTVTRPQQL